MTLPPAATGSETYQLVDGARRWLCEEPDCRRPARWGDATGPLWCDEHHREHSWGHECRCLECGSTHWVEAEHEHYPEICPECGSDATDQGIRARYCDTCGATWVEAPAS